MIVTDVYTENGRVYWPDTLVGSKLDYGINWIDWLTNENDTFVSMAWSPLPAGLTDDGNTDSDDISLITIQTDSAGTYCISGMMTAVENGHEQVLPVQMYLKVAELC